MNPPQSTITVIQGKAYEPVADEQGRIIAHFCREDGVWDGDMAAGIQRKWSTPQIAYKRHLAVLKRPGHVILSETGVPDLLVANLVARNANGIISNANMEVALARLADIAFSLDASVHLQAPTAGREEFDALLSRTLGASGVDVFLYEEPKTESVTG